MVLTIRYLFHEASDFWIFLVFSISLSLILSPVFALSFCQWFFLPLADQMPFVALLDSYWKLKFTSLASLILFSFFVFMDFLFIDTSTISYYFNISSGLLISLIMTY